MAATPDVKAMADVTVRHFCDGVHNTNGDHVQRRTVYKDRYDRYYIKVFGARRDVVRIDGTNEFLLDYHGRTIRKRTVHEIMADHQAAKNG